MFALKDGDIFLTRPVTVTRAWTHAHLFKSLNGENLVKLYEGWLAAGFGEARRMNDGMFLMEFRPDVLAKACPVAERALGSLREQYPTLR